MNKRTLGVIGVLTLVALTAQPARAEVFRSPRLTTSVGTPSIMPFIFFRLFLPPGLHSMSTRNLSSGGDTVLHVLQNSGASMTEVASNDDCAGAGLSSCVSFYSPSGGSYVAWVHSYSTLSSGTTDLLVDGSTQLVMNLFGGHRIFRGWSVGEVVRVAGEESPSYGNDFMVFALANTASYAGHDDDSGPNLYPRLTLLTASQNGAGSFVVGAFPGSSGVARLIQDDPARRDGDGDGLSDDLEASIGTLSNSFDSDRDLVPDGAEVLGNDGFSFSEWAEIDRRDLFVEIDVMTSAPIVTDTRQPFSTLPSEVHEIFLADSAAPRVHTTVFIDNVVPWHEIICFGPCHPAHPDSIDFYSIKAVNFSVNNPERRPYFRYAVWAFRRNNPGQFDPNECSSGQAEIGGNDLIVSMACQGNPVAGQRGTFIHELGHNLGLGHNGNDDPAGAQSLIHESVMSYRYQFSGVPTTARHTYSTATNCESCGTSPKQACVNCRANLFGCSFGCGGCDCSVNEWASISLDGFGWGNGDGATALSSGADTLRTKTVSRGVLASRSAALLARRVELPERDRRARLNELSGQLNTRGVQEGRDYRVTPDLRLMSLCR